MLFAEQNKIEERYITNSELEVLISKLNTSIFDVSIIGKSVLKQNIYQLKFGTGSYKVLLWSQMHGNESTTTRAVFKFLDGVNNGTFPQFLKYFSFVFIPILNPDGAKVFTRVNANKVDLNRDSKELTQPESKLLRQIHDAYQPNLALNMHDQRSIFSAGDTDNPATLSFLAPAYNENTDVNETRLYVMKLISSMYNKIPNTFKRNIGRFDDAFNINCIGDMLTYLKTPTILFEAGFYKNDYQREVAKDLVYQSLINLFDTILENTNEENDLKDYLNIPENKKNFVDILITNFSTTDSKFKELNKIPVVFKEEIVNNTLKLVPYMDFESAPNFKYAHRILDANNQVINNENDVLKILKKLTIS